METVNDIAAIVGLVRDVVLLVLLTVALIALIVVFSKASQILSALKSTVDTLQETVNMVSEKVVEPAASNVDTARRLGGIAGFALGIFQRRKKDKDD